MHFKTLLFIVIGLLSSLQSHAASPFVKGSFAEIQQQHQDDAYLIVFWGKDCAYCMKELETLGQLLAQDSAIKLITVATDPFLEQELIAEKMAEYGLSQYQHWVFSEPSPETLYFDVNPRWRGALPLTFLSTEQGLTAKYGLIDRDELKQWMHQQRGTINDFSLRMNHVE